MDDGIDTSKRPLKVMKKNFRFKVIINDANPVPNVFLWNVRTRF